MIAFPTAFTAAFFFSAVVCTWGQDLFEDTDPTSELPMIWSDTDLTNWLTNDDLSQVFAELDENGDKKLSTVEIGHFVEKHHQDVATLRTGTADMDIQDTSQDGFVNLEEHLKDRAPIMDDGDLRAHETAMFRAADVNGDGLLNQTELVALRFPEMRDDVMNVVLQKAIRDADLVEDGKVSLDEFKVRLAPYEYATKRASNAETLFKRLDSNGDGFLEQEELRNLKSGRIAREDMVNELVSSLDTNNDGGVESAELVDGRNVVSQSQIQDYLMAWAKRRSTLGR